MAKPQFVGYSLPHSFTFIRLRQIGNEYPARIRRVWQFPAMGFTAVGRLSGGVGAPVPARVIVWVIAYLFVWLDLLLIADFYELIAARAKPATRPLDAVEKEILKQVFGLALDSDLIRVDESARLTTRGGKYAYVALRTINCNKPLSPALLVHELVHVWQYQQFGLAYIPLALAAQWSREGYHYGGLSNLKRVRHIAGSLRDFNLEQQAEIVQHYYQQRGSAITGNRNIAGNDDEQTYRYFASFVQPTALE